MNKLEKLLISAATAVAITGCGTTGNSIKTSPEIMRDNYHISTQVLPEVKLTGKEAMYGIEILKRMYDCRTEQCVANRPVIAGYDTFDEKTKEEALIDYVVELGETQGKDGAGRILANLEWKNKNWIANAGIAYNKERALYKDVGTTAFWLGVAVYYSGNQAATVANPARGNAGSVNRTITTGTY